MLPSFATSLRARACLGRTPAIFRLLSTHIPIVKKSSAEEELTSSRHINQLKADIKKDILKAEKVMSYSVEKKRLEKHISLLEGRGFTVENHGDSHSLFVTKTAPSGERIVIDFWEDEGDDQVSIVIEISRPLSPASQQPQNNLYFKCVADEEGLLGLQAVELAPASLLMDGDRDGIYGYPFDRDLSDEMKYHLTKHLHSFGVDSQVAKFATFFIAEKRRYSKLRLLAQASSFLNDEDLGEGVRERCAGLDPLGLLDDDNKQDEQGGQGDGHVEG